MIFSSGLLIIHIVCNDFIDTKGRSNLSSEMLHMNDFVLISNIMMGFR